MENEAQEPKETDQNPDITDRGLEETHRTGRLVIPAPFHPLGKRDSKGHFVNAPGPGRPSKEYSLRNLLKKVPLSKKKQLIEIAYHMAIDEKDVQWANWIARYSDDANGNPDSGLKAEVIIRQYQDWPERLA
jgi:hypothetical protein